MANLLTDHERELLRVMDAGMEAAARAGAHWKDLLWKCYRLKLLYAIRHYGKARSRRVVIEKEVPQCGRS